MGFDKERAYLSGEPGTTGREPFEDSYNSSSGATGNSSSGLTGNTHSGHHGHEHHQHGSSGLTGAVGGTDPAVGHQGHGHSGGYSGVGEHSSGHFGGIANVGGDHGNHGSHGDHHHTSGGVGTGRQFDQTGNTKADSETGATHHTGHQGAAHGLAAAAGNVGGHRDTGADVGVQRQEGSALAGSGEDGSKYGDDRVGALGQNSTAYERTGADGPKTTGAAGTDRFDTDRSHTGNAGSGAGFGPGGERHTEYGGNTASGYGGENDVDKRQKAEGTGGVGGLLTTTDKEFTGRDRLGGASGAYGDETGPFKGNKDGPGNNTALTGREGNSATNPVSGDSSKDVHATRPSDSTHATDTHAHDGEKKGIVEKIKGALGA